MLRSAAPLAGHGSIVTYSSVVPAPTAANQTTADSPAADRVADVVSAVAKADGTSAVSASRDWRRSSCRDEASARQLGADVAAISGRIWPLIAVRSHFSLRRSTVAPELWAAALAAWSAAHAQRRLADGPWCQHEACRLVPRTEPAWAILADDHDVLGLPASLEAWGHDRVGMGATLQLRGAARRTPDAVIAIAPDAATWATLCQLLSWRHEQPAAWDAWQAGLADGPRCDGLVLAVRDHGWAARLSNQGAEVYWRDTGDGTPVPDGLPGLFLPLISHLVPSDRALAELAARSGGGQRGLPPIADDWCFCQLPGLVANAEPLALARSEALRQRLQPAPGRPDQRGLVPLVFPPSPAGVVDADCRLRIAAEAGARLRYGPASGGGQTLPAVVHHRLQHELAVIARKGFSAYLLTVWDLARGRRTCGRGSAASSIVCFCLGLTNVDPIASNLVFERFLSDERHDPPDVDIDFPWDERDAVLATAIERFGREHVAMVATHQKLRRWGALRAAARAVGGYSREAISQIRRRLRAGERYADSDDPDVVVAEDADLHASAAALSGLPCHLGLHCGGLIVTAPPIRDLVPIHPAAKQIDRLPVPAIAWEKDGAERMGLIKIDLLGNRSLAVVRDCLRDLAEEGVLIDERRWRPQDDPLTTRLVSAGRTIGCFYIESPAMRLLNAKAGHYGTVDFDRLVVHSSIVRPAANQWIDRYLTRHGEACAEGAHNPEWYPHPALGTLLSESYGVLSYQEDVMLAARELAGFDLPKQNRLRKALGKSDTRQRLAGMAAAFRDGCGARGVDGSVADLVWDMISSFAGYSFCKAHSASYAMVSYQCAWLKAHHPAHFLARVIANQGGFYSCSAYVEEARRCGVRILPPSLAQGALLTRGIGPGVMRLGLDRVRGLGRTSIARVLAQRTQAPFAGIADAYQRGQLRPRELRALLWAGALDDLRPDLDHAAVRWVAAQVAREGGVGLAADGRALDPAPPADPAPVPLDERDRRSWVSLHCLPRAHPLALFQLPRQRRQTCRDIHPRCAGRVVMVLAWTITRKQVRSTQRRDREGNELANPLVRPMAFVTLEDEFALAESVWFADVYHRDGGVLEYPAPFWVRGKVVIEHGVATLDVSRAWRATR